VAGFPGILERVRDGDDVLVDAYRGEIVIAPGRGKRRARVFNERFEKYRAHADAL